MRASIDVLAERTLQRAVQCILADPHRLWTCTNGDVIQVVAAGLVNAHEGPDFHDMAILHNGTLYVGNGEFHRRSSDWHAHEHDADPRYASLLLHVVLVDDGSACDARWTIVMSAADMWRGIRRRSEEQDHRIELPVEELQHFALLRLLRTSAEAHVHVRRLGMPGAVRAMATQWMERLQAKRHRPWDDAGVRALRRRLPAAPMGMMAIEFQHVAVDDVLGAIQRAERERIAHEGTAMRREVFVNVILPLCLSVSGHEQRIVLFQWYWSARAVHPYGMLLRRFPGISQDYVWQQQGMLEFHRDHGRRTSVCAEAIREYGFANTLEFLRVSEGSVSL